MIIAIDGPSASGKSSTAEALAQKLGIYCMNTGAMYRGVAYVVKNILNYDEGYFHELDHEQIETLLSNNRLHYKFKKDSCAQVFFDNTDITAFLKEPSISQGASIIAVKQEIRDCLTRNFQKIVENRNVVVDGRDIGTIVFPHADIKFFLTARDKIRAQRWQRMLKNKGAQITFKQALDELKMRDERDRTRKIAPLIIAEDAIIIDNSDLTIDQTVQRMMQYIKRIVRPPKS